jgi:DNA-binding transcriptional LysR family regulator
MHQARIRRYLRHGMLPQLSVFEAVARHGSFTRAAEELYMAQPTVSIQMKKLTDTIGLPLHEQIGKRVHLTEAGRALFGACQDLFQRIVQAEDALADLRGLRSGRLRLAVTTTATYFVPRILARFSGLYPGVEISLQIHRREALIDRLTRNEDDLCIFSNPPEGPDYVKQRILPNPMVALAPSGHPLAGEGRIAFARFAAEPFIMREPGSGTRLTAGLSFESHGLKPRVRMELSTNECVKQAILAGLGVSILSRHTLGLDGNQSGLVILDVEGFPIERYWHFVYPVGKQLSVVAQAFMELMRQEAGRLASGTRALSGPPGC